MRKAGTGEADAVKISEVLPFVEYDLQRQLILKLKVLGMNAAFGYSCQIQVGNDLVIATATCTAVWLESLPSPPPIQIVRSRDGRSQQEMRLASLQRQLEELMTLNKDTLDKQHSHNRMILRRRQHLASAGVGRAGAYRERQCQYSLNSASGAVDGTSTPMIDTFREAAVDEHVSAHAGEDKSLASLEGSMDSYSATASSTGSSSSSSTSSSSSSDEGTSDGDDSSSLESPPSSSSSSSTEEDDVDEEDPAVEGEDAAVVQEDTELFVGADASVQHTASKSGRSPKVSAQREAQDTTTRSSRLHSSATSSSRDKKPPAEVVHRKRRIVYKDDRAPFLMEVDDETDSDIVAVLNDWVAPIGFDMVNTLVSGRFLVENLTPFTRMSANLCLCCFPAVVVYSRLPGDPHDGGQRRGGHAPRPHPGAQDGGRGLPELPQQRGAEQHAVQAVLGGLPAPVLHRQGPHAVPGT
jgi:hypothetical protein